MTPLYRAAGRYIGVSFAALGLPVPKDEAVAVLERLGFIRVPTDIAAMAARLVGTPRYRRGARMREAPATVDCSSFVKWLYSRVGIWIPRRSIQQSRCGEPVGPDGIRGGDLVFASGRRNYFHDDPRQGIGHVAIATGRTAIVHAGKRGVVRAPLMTLTGSRFRGARRLIGDSDDFAAFIWPEHWEVETDDDVRWIILQNL